MCALPLAFVLSAACRQDMHDQPRLKPYAKSDFFEDERSARPLVPGTVARGFLTVDDVRHTGRREGVLAAQLPVPLDAALLARGQAQFQTFCAPCHGATGRGDGMIVQRGFKRPSSFHVDRLRQVPVGHVFDVVTNGLGAMSSYASQVPVDDRWAIAAYVRALQLSQHAPLEAVPEAERARLDESLGLRAAPPVEAPAETR